MGFVRTCLFISFVGISSVILGQQLRVPDLSGSYLDHSYVYFNSASLSAISENGNASFLHKQGLGAFSVFSQNYVNVNYLFGSDSVKNQGVGLRVINDRAGDYIAVNRVSLMYARSVSLTKEYALHFGLAPTLISYRKEAQSFGGVANSANLDAGLWLKSKKVDFGFSANQLIPSNIQVVDEIDSLNTQYVINAKYKHRIDFNFDVDLQFLYSVNSQLPNHEVFGATVNYLDKVRFALNCEVSRNLVLLLGMKNLKLTNNMGLMSLDIAYAFPSSKEVYRPRNVMEIILNYDF